MYLLGESNLPHGVQSCSELPQGIKINSEVLAKADVP